MNLQDVFKKIELALTPEKVELASMSLADGTMVEAEVFEAGANVFLVGGDGEKIAAPIGEHKLEDGRVLVIEEEGIIKEIKEAAAEEEATVEVEVEAAEEAPADMTIKDIVEMVSALREEVEMMKQEMGKKQEMTEEVVAEEPAEVEVAMAAQKPIVAAPVEKKHELKFHIGAERVANTKDRVFSKLFNN